MKTNFTFILLAILVSCSGKDSKKSSPEVSPVVEDTKITREVTLEKGQECVMQTASERKSVFIKIEAGKVDVREMVGKSYHTKNIDIEGLAIPSTNIRLRGHSFRLLSEISRSSMGRETNPRILSRSFMVKIKRDGSGSIKLLEEKIRSVDRFENIATLSECQESEVETPL